MPANPLFYRSVVPLNRESHAGLRLRTDRGMFGFARGAHLIPAVLDEFAAACRDLPILFIAEGQAVTPAFLVGTRPDDNLMIDAEGGWTGAYVPAFLRRYPFIKGEVPGSDPIVCLDESADMLKGESGQALFENGTETSVLRERIDLMNGYAEAANRTDAFCRALGELNLLKSATVDFRREGASSTIHGLMAVDEERLGILSDPDYLRLRHENLIGPIYAHLLSLGAIDLLARRGVA